MKKYVPVLLMLSMFSCGQNIAKYCDQAQKAYITANAAAQAAKPMIPPDVWVNCVMPLDAIANDSIISCYRAAASGNPADIIQAIADTAITFSDNLAKMKGCNIN